ncbi:hypothetical protein HMPREF1404_00190 [Helicobacter pylori GAM210Bi]|nr:hypothetical protein HMPREF1404_00190 [Helicobacter pylori GAM210Bi]
MFPLPKSPTAKLNTAIDSFNNFKRVVGKIGVLKRSILYYLNSSFPLRLYKKY